MPLFGFRFRGAQWVWVRSLRLNVGMEGVSDEWVRAGPGGSRGFRAGKGGGCTIRLLLRDPVLGMTPRTLKAGSGVARENGKV